MTLSIRLDPELESELARAAAQAGRSKSELVKASLREYLARLARRKTPYERGEGLLGDSPATAATLDLTSKDRVRSTIVERLRAENDR